MTLPLLRALLLALSLACVCRCQDPARFVVGSKDFTESHVLAELLAQTVAAHTDLKVEVEAGLGGTMTCLQALRSGAIDAYAEYTGTGWAVVLGQEGVPGGALQTYWRVQQLCREREDLEWLAPFGFANGYALAMREGQAQELGVRTLSDLARHAGVLRAAFSIEFHERADGWPGLRDRYGLRFGEVRTIEHALAYQAVEASTVDVVDVYTTDGRLQGLPLRVLVDDLQFFPPYDAAPVVRGATLRAHPEVRAALGRLAFALRDTDMIALNHRAEQSGGRVAAVVAAWLAERGLLGGGADQVQDLRPQSLVGFVQSRAGALLARCLEHLLLALTAVLLATACGVPLAVAVRHRPRAERLLLGFAGVMQTVPSLALLAFLVAIPGLGLSVRSAVLALFLYALLPIVRNTLAGLRSVPAELLETAAAIGLDARQSLRRVQLPLALPTIAAGVRIATVTSLGVATLAAFLGAGGLGEPILQGLYLADVRLVLLGAVPAAGLTLLVDAWLGRLTRRLSPGPRGAAQGRSQRSA